MNNRTRIYYSDAQKSEMWDRWQRGESLKSIGRHFDRGSSSIYGVLSRSGGIRPAVRKRSRLALSLSEREEISRGIARDDSLRSIAQQLGHAPSTISREVQRNGSLDQYRASEAEQAAWDRAHRPKACKLITHPTLRARVVNKLQLQWAPQQIAGWLKRAYPGDEGTHVSHETIYKSLFIQARGALKKELLAHLRTQRTNSRTPCQC
jgi:IS30 family transposase